MALRFFSALNRIPYKSSSFQVKFTSTMSRKGLMLGIYSSESKISVEEQLTCAAKKFNADNAGKLLTYLNYTEPLKDGKCRMFYGISDKFDALAVVGIGKQGEEYVEEEDLHQGRENVRRAVAIGAVALRDVGMREIYIDPCGCADAAAEGAFLSTFNFDELKSKPDSKKPNPTLHLYDYGGIGSVELEKAWNRGQKLAEGENVVRRLSDLPANMLTPTLFADYAARVLADYSNIKVIKRDRKWAEEKKMGAFLAVAQGSDQPPVFLELHLSAKKSTKPPLCFVGKGVCFDSGGISLKPSKSMGSMRFDMTGAACVLSTILTLAKLGSELPFDVIGLIPLVENLPSGKAIKPGDVVYAMNGMSIEVENTDAEGRLILADGLCYADTFKPSHVIDIATLTGAILVALGDSAAGVFTNDKVLWKEIHKAAANTGERVWRLPLYKHFSEQVKLESIDLCNTSKPSFQGLGGSCIAAAFLKEFTTSNSWMHIDIAGVVERKGSNPLYNTSMTGKPLRALVEFCELLAKSS
ncbi:Cytosol aminopeptidase [Trichinella zimbabwensis]|uniref:Cytosol aminopeptidase n=1 Tax=Trichinella zimbabwensis TaxID=268475 RepID=A0A0V1HBH4_9BILA|nr:Cytosol aminopeptidase [Trichinella zimbabwensis]